MGIGMENTHDISLQINLQTIQDYLSCKESIFLVLTDEEGNEVTLPSGIPLFCYQKENEPACCNCYETALAAVKDCADKMMVTYCPEGLYQLVSVTNIYYENKALYLHCGRVKEEIKINNSKSIIQAIYDMPVAITDQTYKSSSSSHKAPHGLTSQELKVLKCLADGLSNKDIAEVLFLSNSTIKTHISHILVKLDVKNRTEASLYAINHELLNEIVL